MTQDPRQDPPIRGSSDGYRIWFLWPLAAALAALVLLLVRAPWTGTARRMPAAPVRVEATAGAGQSLKGELDELADSLLTDSILSIVQSYYVDPTRVRNRSLIRTAFAALSTSPRIQAGLDAKEAWIEVDGDRQSFPLSMRPGYQEVLDVFTGVARRLDGTDIEVPMGEGEEKNATGSVLLLNALLSSLDAHSALLSPESYRELRQGTEGSFGGLGVLVGIRDDVLTVIKPLPRSPASRAGIKKYDRILGIDGVSTYGQTLDDLVEHMRGDPGTTVNLSLLREGDISPARLSMQREIIHVDSVTTKQIDRKGTKILHLTVENFASRTSKEVLSAIKESRRRNGGKLHGLIMDLRSNPGGLLDQAVQVVDLFIQSGVIVTTKGRRQEVETAGNGFDEVDFPVVVLIDGESASASEIVAGALQDHGRGVVIGQPSFGKGSVQTIFELPGERALKLTIARYYTPHGRSIQNVGIIPDVWMQPVYPGEENSNLLGYYRYKNERFLKHALTRVSDSSDGKGPRLASLRVPAQKAFYLADEKEDESSLDRELEMGIDIIRKLHKTYGDSLPVGSKRASHWLGLAGPAIRRRLARMNDEVDQWLEKSHGVEWQSGAPVGFKRQVAAEAFIDGEDTVQPGGSLDISWKLTNRESRPIDRVSVFLRSETPGFETREVLVGRLGVQETREGHTKLEIPAWIEPGLLNLRFGVAVDAWPLPAATATLPVRLVPRQVAELQAQVTLAAEAGGKVPGKLEGGEKARVSIKIANVGEADATDLFVGLANLSGSQVEVNAEPVRVKRIGAGESKTIEVGIRGASKLYTDDIGLGLHVTSSDLRWPFRQRVQVMAVPNAKRKNVSNLLGH